MATQGDSLIRKTQKGLSVLAFETTKQSRILKKRMRIAALQKEVKADLRDLGSLVFNSVLHDQPGILEEEEVKLLVEGIRVNRDEIEHLRDGIARMNRAHKHFESNEVDAATPTGAPAAAPETTPPEPVVKPEIQPANDPEPPATPSDKAAEGGETTPETQDPGAETRPKRTCKTAKDPVDAKTSAPKAAKPATKRKPTAQKKPATPEPPPAEPASEAPPGGVPEKKDNP